MSQRDLAVAGGGISGMEAAVGIADQGRMVYLVEKSMELGGNAKVLETTWQGEKIGPYLGDLVTRVKHHPNIELFMETKVTGTTGTMGNFSTTLTTLNGKGKEINIDHAVTVHYRLTQLGHLLLVGRRPVHADTTQERDVLIADTCLLQFA